ncbi:IS701 family transposase [Arthrobacter sp. VKM Ac-2550]|uniref:IS701 family transposase n=1 Tax=Crystallibacter permensis TaxID=1938888 RepID=UPI0022263C39|nr:IS701 family transposase [Arthrobacter sp. VKM Ac-2550]MCW2135476.1 transposase, IS4 family [Arthrobacter sp. VKM Ac-2550]
MEPDELAEARAALEDFVGQVFGSLTRSDQRAKGRLYLQGLMLDGRRKSMQPMGERLGVDYQQLQQFVSSSPWAVEPVRRQLANIAMETIAPEAWVIDDTGFKKDGRSSPCVARQYSGTLGKVGNCQIAVSLHAATDAASCPLNWRLYVPEAWDDTCAETNEDAEKTMLRRQKAKIPDTIRHRTKWSQALEMIDEAATWGWAPPAVVADAGYGDTTGFRLGLDARSIPYVLAVKASTSAYPADAVPETVPATGSRGRPPAPRYRDKPSSLREIAISTGRVHRRQVTWRRGTKTGPANKLASMTSKFLAVRVRPANRDIPLAADGSLPEEWLICEWPAGAAEPTDYWLSSLPADTSLKTMVRLAKMRWRIEHDYRELKTGLGLAHFEGRTYPGWHRHVTLVTAAHLFITRLRLTRPKANGAA